MSCAERKKVVVVGGGIAGSLSAKLLESIADVTLVDPKDHLEIPYAQLRCKVEPEFSDRSLVLHADYLKETRIVTGFAETASTTEVVMSNGDILPYDYLIVATGSVHRGPTTKAQRMKEFFSDHAKIKEAKSILVIGGGPVGVELAGEIVVDYPGKKVILVHGGSRLIEFLGPKASEKALAWLRKKNVEVLLNERVNVESISLEGVYKTMNGKVIEADCHFSCIGSKVSSSWMRSSFLKEALDESGRVKVDESLRVEGHSNVFAVGDVTAIQEIKQGFLAGRQVHVLVHNMKLLLTEDHDVKLKPYVAMVDPMGIVSLGRNIAVAQIPVIGAIIGWIPGILKCKDLFVGKTRSGLGLKA